MHGTHPSVGSGCARQITRESDLFELVRIENKHSVDMDEGIRSVLTTYADTYSLLPPGEAIRLVLFDDGDGTDGRCRTASGFCFYTGLFNLNSIRMVPRQNRGGATRMEARGHGRQ